MIKFSTNLLTDTDYSILSSKVCALHNTWNASKQERKKEKKIYQGYNSSNKRVFTNQGIVKFCHLVQ